MQPDSDLAFFTSDSYRQPTGLILPPEDIFDVGRIHTQIETLAEDAKGKKDIQSGTVEALLAARKTGLAAIAAAIAVRPLEARRAARAYAYLTDCVVRTVVEVACRHIVPPASTRDLSTISIVAVGGYGRAEMAPHSDVDLLFLTPDRPGSWAESLVEASLYMLWDLRLKVGHASRSLAETLKRAREDYTIRTSVLELRYLIGEVNLAEALKDRLRSELFNRTGADLIDAKLKERRERHRKQGQQRYVVEPNVKEGKGGLRDLQSLFWIAKYLHGVDQPAELVGIGVFSREEYDRFDRA